MLAFDHGYFQGPTTGIERPDINIARLPYADVLMCTRGGLRTSSHRRLPNRSFSASAGQSILTELSNELVAVGIEDAIRLDAAALAAQVYIGAEYEPPSATLSVNRHGCQIWYPHPRRYWRWNGHEQGSTLLWSRHTHMCRDRRALYQKLLL